MIIHILDPMHLSISSVTSVGGQGRSYTGKQSFRSEAHAWLQEDMREAGRQGGGAAGGASRGGGGSGLEGSTIFVGGVPPESNDIMTLMMHFKQFGRILNENRYELPDLDDPELVFLPVNPATGSPLYRTPITYEPGRVDEFGLVDNALTEGEVGLARLGDPAQPAEDARGTRLETRARRPALPRAAEPRWRTPLRRWPTTRSLLWTRSCATRCSTACSGSCTSAASAS